MCLQRFKSKGLDPGILEITIFLNLYFKGSSEIGKDLQFVFNNWSGAPAKAEY